MSLHISEAIVGLALTKRHATDQILCKNKKVILLFFVWFALICFTQAEFRADSAERSIKTLQHELDKLQGMWPTHWHSHSPGILCTQPWVLLNSRQYWTSVLKCRQALHTFWTISGNQIWGVALTFFHFKTTILVKAHFILKNVVKFFLAYSILMNTVLKRFDFVVSL